MTVTEQDLIKLFRTGTTAELNDAIAKLAEQHGQRESERIYDRALKKYDRETEQQDDMVRTNMLAAHALCGRLIEDMPDGVVFSSWEIMPGYVGGAYSTLDNTNSAKRGLAILANRFGLVYAEEPKAGVVQVNAAGELGGVQVQLWAHVPQRAQAGGES